MLTEAIGLVRIFPSFLDGGVQQEDRLIWRMLLMEALPISSQEPGTSAALFLISALICICAGPKWPLAKKIVILCFHLPEMVEVGLQAAKMR